MKPLAMLALFAGLTFAQSNPYAAVENWAQMPAGRTWGSTSAVDIDPDGTSVWVAERCGRNSCVGSDLSTILKFDASGTLVRSFGAGMFVFPHGMHVDREGNVWVTDGVPPGAGTSLEGGHFVRKFSPEGKILLTLGQPGAPGNGPNNFNQPSDVVVAGLLLVLGFYTRLNNLPMALAVAAFALPITLPASAMWRPRVWWPSALRRR